MEVNQIDKEGNSTHPHIINVNDQHSHTQVVKDKVHSASTTDGQSDAYVTSQTEQKPEKICPACADSDMTDNSTCKDNANKAISNEDEKNVSQETPKSQPLKTEKIDPTAIPEVPGENLNLATSI